MRGFSLTELILTLMVAISLAAIGMPLFSEGQKSAIFSAFANEITAQLIQARQQAILTGAPVEIEFPETGPYLYQSQSLGVPIAAKKRHIASGHQLPSLGLAGQSLAHPTSGELITQPLRSTHGRKLRFGRKGSSSGTLVFQLGPQRILCIVISGATGRSRAYVLHNGEWLDY